MGYYRRRGCCVCSRCGTTRNGAKTSQRTWRYLPEGACALRTPPLESPVGAPRPLSPCACVIRAAPAVESRVRARERLPFGRFLSRLPRRPRGRGRPGRYRAGEGPGRFPDPPRVCREPALWPGREEGGRRGRWRRPGRAGRGGASCPWEWGPQLRLPLRTPCPPLSRACIWVQHRCLSRVPPEPQT